jgi:histone H3/H4
VSDLVKLESLPVETLAEMANEAAAACEASGRKTVEHAIRCGRALLAAKAVVPHGGWAEWLSEHFEHSGRLARKYIEIANWHGRANLEDANSLGDALRIIADSPEKQAKKAEREARKAEAPPKPLAPATPAPQPQRHVVETITEASTYHSVAAQVAKPEWLADPDELDRPEEDDLPELPKTNIHHTTENRRQPDARETDRIGIVPPDDPRTLQDGAWYQWSEAANRLLPITDDDILAEAERLNRE